MDLKKILEDGTELSIAPLTFGRARLCIASPESLPMFYDDGW